MPLLSDTWAIEAVERASGRSAADVHRRMKRGVDGLATVASTAPLFGLLATILCMSNAFPGCGGERSICMAAVFDRLSDSLIPAALGLLVAVPALWCYKYMRGEMEAIDIEMRNATLELLNRLIHLRRRSIP
jgi:biopolymer transport protein ExbB/TolQ